MNVYFAIGGLLAGLLAAAYLISRIFHLSGNSFWILTAALEGLGIIGSAIYLVIQMKRNASALKPAGGGGGGSGGGGAAPAGGGEGGDEIDLLIRDAAARIQASQLGRTAKLGDLPAIFLVGERGTTKTSTMLACGLEPELLAGQVYQDNAVVPTRTANFWLARQSIFVEAGGALLADPGRWARLIRRLQPGKMRSVVGKGQMAPRAALVCLDCESFLKPGATDAMAGTARGLAARLGEISQILGISLPVYVLFTKLDRVPFLTDYVGNLSNDEATQVLGVTLPMRTGQSTGVYAEETTRLLTSLFNELAGSLCDWRPEFLSREHDAAKLSGVYEFPREFRKLRAPVVQFLVDLCRPSQLRANPFLRGFYFSGVRPVIVEDAARATPRAPEPQESFGQKAGATGMFNYAQMQAQQAAEPPRVAGTRRVPQWVFLTHLFNEIILRDRTAMSASGASSKASGLRRILLAVLAGLLLVLIVLWTVSYIGNSRLESRVIEAARGISAADASGPQLGSSLARLETLRQSLATLTEYQIHTPLRLRWGLYVGDQLYCDVRKIYYKRFSSLLLGPTQASIEDWLQKLPRAAGSADDYHTPYDILKAYLITLSHPDKSTRDFLGPVLLSRWESGRAVDKNLEQLARNQFDTYAGELAAGSPAGCTIFFKKEDTAGVAHARAYLNSFGDLDRVYAFMLSEAGKQKRSIIFNRDVPGSAEVVLNRYEVPAAFTKPGWAFMQGAFKDLKKYYGGEEWVLGPSAAAKADYKELEDKLRARYVADYIKHWRAYLRVSVVNRYKSPEDAAAKLALLSGNSSPLLALFAIASQNISVDPAVSKAFQPPLWVAGTMEQLIVDHTRGYATALATLQSSMAQYAENQQNQDAARQTKANASQAKLTTVTVAQNFNNDPEAGVNRTVQKLLEDPITYAEDLLKSQVPAEINAGARGMCGQFNALMRKYPFSPTSNVEASLQETSAFFRPGDGAFWTFYDSKLKNLLTLQGHQFVPNSAASADVKITPGFMTFMNHVATFSTYVYPNASPQPKLAYTLKPQPSEGVDAVTLAIEGQTLTSTTAQPVSKEFVWPGPAPSGVNLQGRISGSSNLSLLSFEGPWAVFRFFRDAENWQAGAGPDFNLYWTPRTGNQPMRLANNNPVTIRFTLNLGGAPAIFKKDYFSSFNCAMPAAAQ